MAAAPCEVPGVDQTPRTVVLELTPELESAAVGTQVSAGAENQPGEGLGEALGSSSSVRTGNVSAVPEGKGPLYKCAICAEFVYESQLEYHVTICPDPNDSSSLLSTPGPEQPVTAEPDVPFSVDNHAAASLAQAGTGRSAAMLRLRHAHAAGRRYLRAVAAQAQRGDSRRMQSGKCKDLTFEECLAQHPSYCSWVLARGDKLSTAEYGDFLNFLRKRTQEAPADPQPAGSGVTESDHAPDPRDQNKVGFGKHKDLTYAELLSKQPAYCLWVQQTAAQGDKAGGGMRAFADYLEGKTIAAASNPQRKTWARTASARASPASTANLTPNSGRGTLADGSWLVNFGKYKGSSFSEVYTKDPQYCEFITNSVLLADDPAKAPSKDSLTFTAYIQHRARQEETAPE
ncbi:ftsH3 [Symbiodinium sp. CCMP2592]|nr:ftsH3 [Symbiodinium sp. CCMP2592]